MSGKSSDDKDPTQVTSPEKDPIYLIRRSAEACLSVLRISTPGDAIVGITWPDNGSEQQWYNCKGQWQWGGDRSLCMSPVPGKTTVGLDKCSSSSAVWVLDGEGRMTIDERALWVPSWKTVTPVFLKHITDSEHEKWCTDAQLKASLAGVKPAVYPFPGDDITTYEQEIARGILNRIAPLNEPLPYPRDVATFPGTVDNATHRVGETITLDLSALGQASNLRMTSPRDWQATDLYVAAGDVFVVDLPGDLPPQRADQILIRIGANTDILRPSQKAVKHKNFKRMPNISEVFTVKAGKNHLRSQYGGLLIFNFKVGDLFKVDVHVENVVKAPYFCLDKTTPDEWDTYRNRDAPQALFESKRVVLVVKSDVIKDIPFPDQLMQRYEEVIDYHNDLAGFSDDDPPPRGKFWLVNDIEISCGSAHAGFPIMVGPCNNLACLHSPYCWCIWHELGHDYQQAHFWSYAYGSESSVNLFSLHAEENIFHIDKLKDKGVYSKVAKKVDEGLKFPEANATEKLVFLMEIKYFFPEGWDMYRRLNKTTRALSDAEAERIKVSHQMQIDFLYKNLSKNVGHDLILTNQRWGIGISTEAQEEIKKLGLPQAPADLSIRD